MREILFRGKRTDNGKWVNGYVTRIKHSDDNGKVESYYFNALDELGWVAECAVSAETICQYTGLTDKNGRKIFEGDICKYHNTEDKDGIAVIGEDYAEWRSGIIRQKEIMTPLFYLKCSSEWEVIGNIFDNSELIGDKP